MKKITGVITILAVLAGTLLATGCGLGEAIRATYYKWYKYTGDVKINIPLGSDANADDKGDGLHTLKDAEFYVYFDPDEGLTLAVQSEKTENVEMLGGLFSTDVEVTMGGTKQYPTSKFGVGNWTTLKTTVTLTACDAPKVYSDPEHCVILAGDKAGEFKIQWKKVFARTLFKALLGEDYYD